MVTLKDISDLPMFTNEADKDRLSMGDKIGQIAGMICTVLLFAFFAYHQTADTGFFTDKFDAAGALMLYTAILFGIIPSVLRLIYGVKNRFRPFDFLGIVLFLVLNIYFLTVFPLNMEYFAVPLPDFLRFALDWIDEPMAKLLLTLSLFGAMIGAFFTIFLYFGVRETLMRRKQGPSGE